jgi:hypothetical protein
MSKEVVRSIWLAVGCSLLFVLLGFAPMWVNDWWFSQGEIWSATQASAAAAMPVGESAPSDVTGPLKMAKTPTVYGDPAMHP